MMSILLYLLSMLVGAAAGFLGLRLLQLIRVAVHAPAEPPDPHGFVLASMMGLFWLVFFVAMMATNELPDYVRTRGYRPCRATVQRAEVVTKRGSVYFPQPVSGWIPGNVTWLVLSYRYEVDGKLYQDTLRLREAHGGEPSWSHGKAPGDTFPLYYDPADPQETSLARSYAGLGGHARGFASFIAIWIVLMGIVDRFARRKETRG